MLCAAEGVCAAVAPDDGAVAVPHHRGEDVRPAGVPGGRGVTACSRGREGGEEGKRRREEREGGQQDTSVSSSSMCPKYTDVYFRASSAKQSEIGDGVEC